MEFKHQMIGSTLLFKYHDPVFNDIGIIQFKRNLAALLEKYPVKDIILDMEHVKIVDNIGLSAAMFARRYTKANGNNCIIAMPRPKVISLLKTSRLTDSFHIIERKDEYQAYLKSLVENAEKERAEREAAKARKAEDARKVEEIRKAEDAVKSEGATQQKTAVDHPDNNTPSEPVKKNSNAKRTRRKSQNKQNENN